MDRICSPWLSRLLVGAIAFAAAFSSYAYTMSPGLPPGHDSAELITAGITLGIPHPPGYPLYVMLSYLFTQLFPGSPVYACNMLSVICGSLAVAFIAVAFTIMAKSELVGLGMALALAWARTPWRMALGAEVFALHLALAAAIILCAVLWSQAELANRRKLLCLMAFCLGLALSHHHTIILLLPGLGLYLWLAKEQNLQDKKAVRDSLGKNEIGFAWYQVFFLLLGLMPYLYLPLRASQHPLLNWGNPSNLERFMWVVTRQGYGGVRLNTATSSITSCGYHLGHWLLSLSWLQFPIIGTLIGIIGIIYTWVRRHPEGILFGSFFIIAGPIFTIVSNQPVGEGYLDMLERFYAASDLGFAGLIVVGIIAIRDSSWRQIGSSSQMAIPGRHWIVIALAIIIPILGISHNYEAASERQQYLVDDSLQVMTDCIPDEALVITCSDLTSGMFMYANKVQGLNITHIPIGLLPSPWFQAQLPTPLLQAYRDGGLERLLIMAKRSGMAVYTDYPLKSSDGQFIPEGLMYRFQTADDPKQDVISLALKSLVLLNKVDREDRGTYEITPNRPFWSNYLATRWREAYLILVTPLKDYYPEASFNAQKQANKIVTTPY